MMNKIQDCAPEELCENLHQCSDWAKCGSKHPEWALENNVCLQYLKTGKCDAMEECKHNHFTWTEMEALTGDHQDKDDIIQFSEDPFSEEEEESHQSEDGESSYYSYLSTNNTSKFNEFGDIDSDCENTQFLNFEFDPQYLFGDIDELTTTEEKKEKIEMIDLQKPKLKVQSGVFMQKMSSQEVADSSFGPIFTKSTAIDEVSRENSTTASAVTYGNMMNCEDFALSYKAEGLAAPDNTPWKSKPSSFFQMATSSQIDFDPQNNPENFELTVEQWDFCFQYYPEYCLSPYDMMKWLHDQALIHEKTSIQQSNV